MNPLSLSSHERTRRGFILHVILIANIILLCFANIYIFQISKSTAGIRDGFRMEAIFLILLYFVFLFVLARRHHVRLASFLLIAIYFAITTHCSARWGVSLPATLLGYTLIITISSILLGNKAGFIMTGLIFVTILRIGQDEISRGIIPAWKSSPVDIRDVIFYSIMLFVIMTVSWLSNRETERSLARAEQSERDLQKERDQLEITVAERTEELKQVQAERVSQLYHFAEFGRISSGLFHDLVNPLLSLSLNMQDVGNSLHADLPGIKANIDRSLAASRKMERFIHAIRGQMRIQDLKEEFALNAVIDDVLLLFNYKALKAGVTLDFKSNERITLYQNPLEFQQIVSNLVSNAIDSYEGTTLPTSERMVTIRMSTEGENVKIEVADKGNGIDARILSHIFDPFFTSKDRTKGMGLGLSTTKRLVEKNFGGSIDFKTHTGKGTRFIITLPRNAHHIHPIADTALSPLA